MIKYNLRNFKLYTPDGDDLKSRGLSGFHDVIFLKSEDGLDWYESQKLFSDDTIKIMYDSDGIIRSLVDKPVPQRGNTYAVSMFFPAGFSVVEIAVEDYPVDCCIDGTWKFDGEKVYQDVAIVDSDILRGNTSQRNSLAAKAAAAIAMINASAAVGNPRDGDSENLQLLQAYLDQLRDVALDTESPAWPTIPAFIL